MHCKLLGLLHSITPAVAGSRGMFKQKQYTLKIVVGRHVQLTTDMQNELEAWRKLVHNLDSRLNHLCEL